MQPALRQTALLGSLRLYAWILSVFLCAPVPALSSPLPQTTFPWQTDWTWELLRAHVTQEAPGAIGTLERIRRTLPLPQARIVFRHLAALPNLADVRRLSDRAAIDRHTTRLTTVKEALADALKDFTPRNELGDRLLAVERLARARARLKDSFLPDLLGRAYQPVPVREKSHARLRVRFDFSTALALLDRLRADSTTDDQWTRLADTPILRQLVAHRGPLRLRREQLMDWWRRAQAPDPVNRLYEWVYPGSFYDYGGVAVNAEGYRAVVRQLQAAQGNILERVRARLSRYLPDDLDLNAEVQFLFAGDADGWANRGGLGIDLEHFGDDFERLVTVITHECFHGAQGAARLPITTLADSETDRALHNGLLSSVWSEGIASYVGAPWGAAALSREEIARGFRQFTDACDTLLRHHDRNAYQKQIQQGLSMAGPLYRMGWRMAKVMEEKRGTGAVAELQTLGPAVFFARYVESYRGAPLTDIPAEQRFRPDIEEAIRRIAEGMDAPTLLASVRIARLTDAARARREALRLVEAQGKRPEAGLALTLLGESFARQRRDFVMAERLLVPGLRLLGARANDLIRREGSLFLSLGAKPQAVAVFQVGVELAPDNPVCHYLLGEGCRAAGDLPRARAAYRRALALDPQHDAARRALTRIGEE